MLVIPMPGAMPIPEFEFEFELELVPVPVLGPEVERWCSWLDPEGNTI